MRIAPGLLAGLLLTLDAPAAEPVKAVAATQSRSTPDLRVLELEERARQLYPRRRDAPLRYLNISDGEIREVQSIARKYRMAELLNISPVVTGCACEEGDCSEQLYIVGSVDGQTVGLQLSRRKNRWGVGMVQQWWLEYAALRAREKVMDFRSYQEARVQLLMAFPMCAGTSAAQSVQVAEKPSTK